MRLIDADAFKKILSEHEMKHDKRRSFDDYDCGAANAYEHANDLLDEMPTVERPQGECIFKNGKYRRTACGEKAIYVCPGLSTIPKAILTDFCPKCGVQMNAKALEMIRKREGSE